MRPAPVGETGGPRRRQNLAVGLILLALGAGLGVGTFGVSALPGQDSLGPRLFPALIGAGLLILGAAHLIEAARARHAADPPLPGSPDAQSDGKSDGQPDGQAGHWPALLWVVAGVGLGAATYTALGFVPAATAVFVLTARGFAGAFDWRHLASGLVLAAIAFVGFTEGLGLRLPTGIFAAWF